jgi:hypothetical protein
VELPVLDRGMAAVEAGLTGGGGGVGGAGPVAAGESAGLAAVREQMTSFERQVEAGLGHIIALYYRSSTLYHIHQYNRSLFF